MDTLNAIRARRTVKQFTGAALGREDLQTLAELATWAPNHHLNQPWRLYLLDQPAVRRLATWLTESAASWMRPDTLPKALEIARERLPGLGGMIQVTCVRQADATGQAEDRDACAAAVQNILLGATALGLGSFWSSTGVMRAEPLARYLGIDPAQEAFVASIWLGSPAKEPAIPRRQALEHVARWI